MMTPRRGRAPRSGSLETRRSIPCTVPNRDVSPINGTVKPPPEVAAQTISGRKDVEKLLIFDRARIAERRPTWTDPWNRVLR
ncbi:MAG: hypothetical protein HY002_17170 [Candidatus Rokubacteria bacterium]|nr:hypothetical protein [Candidatus Rokubacteria bacterium]